MPELPDVEVIRLDIEPDVVGRIFSGVTLNWPRAVRHPSPGEFQEAVPGAKIVGLRRRAKYFLFDLDRDDTLIIHLRMTGSLRVVPDGEPMHRFTQTIFHLDDAHQLRFVDPRKLGALWLVDEVDSVIGGLGPEPLEPSFTPEVLSEMLAGRSAPVKALLCDQRLIAGIGNIYADEILFDAGIHPLRRAGSLAETEIEALRNSIRGVLADATERLSRRLPADAPPTEELGMEVIRVPRDGGTPCPVCSRAIERIRVRGRGTYFCPGCQPL